MGLLTVADYSELQQLAGVYLEDSFVLRIEEGPGTLNFTLDAVLTPEHPEYAPPPPNEQYCYRKGKLILQPMRIEWIARRQASFHDATGEEDLGNIDVFKVEAGRYHLEGDWGVVDVEARFPPEFILTDA